MVMSGPLPVGTWAMNSSWIFAKSFWTSLTSTPDSSVKAAAASFNTAARSASTHTVSVLESASDAVPLEFDPAEQPARARDAATANAPAASRPFFFTIIGVPFIINIDICASGYMYTCHFCDWQPSL